MGKKTLVKTKKEPNIRRRSNGLWEARKQINGIPIRTTNSCSCSLNNFLQDVFPMHK